ncbi:glucose-1-phosphate adenylyltransferase subunit GlgD [Sporolactobacillus putidus]|uniref:Glucose-1-phosphate adenylyltransferase n=1 Tax=Sporolactobacillus putidus TaxID=492735 RepID=A0A917W0S9_9BACL|nr:glucose-1-phosphate adenylyltransferase subunit GlgD [Sporolactobacillus putidus]GGL47349.1 glucose-1-phosphate adenylyltransferase [Sporolactobacillus putidus]
MMRKNKICGILNLTESRLATNPLTLFRPVAALPFGCRYRLIDFPLTNLTTAGVETVGVFLNDSLRSIYDHVRSGKEWGLDSVDGGLFFFSALSADRGTGLRGTDGDIYNYFKNIEFIEKSGADYVVVMGTRMLCNVDVKAVLRSHIEQGADITVVYKSVDYLSKEDEHVSCMTIGDDGLVKGLKSCSLQMKENKALVNMEIYLMKSSLLMRLIRNVVAENEHCNLNDVLHQAMIKLPTNGFEYTGYLKSINSVKSYFDANIDMLQEANMTALLKGSQSIHTKVKNEVPTFYARTSDVSDSLVANGCIMNGEVTHSVIFRNVTIEKNAVVNSSIILQGSYIGSGAELRYVILDKQVRIEPNTKLIGTKDKPIVIEKNSVISRIFEEGEQVLKGVSQFHRNELEV